MTLWQVFRGEVPAEMLPDEVPPSSIRPEKTGSTALMVWRGAGAFGGRG